MFDLKFLPNNHELKPYLVTHASYGKAETKRIFAEDLDNAYTIARRQGLRVYHTASCPLPEERTVMRYFFGDEGFRITCERHPQ